MKKAITLLLAVIAGIMFMSAAAWAADNEITVVVNGVPVSFNTPPYIEDGRIMASSRPIAEAMGWSVDMNRNALYLQNHGTLECIPGKVYYTYYKATVGLIDEELHIRHYDTVGGYDIHHFKFGHYPVKDREVCPGEKACIILEEESSYQLTVKPLYIGDELFVAVRDLAAALYATVEWNGDTRMVTITNGPLPYYDGEGLSDDYREWLLQRTMAMYAPYNQQPAPEPSEDEVLIALKAEVIRIINEARVQEGLKPLQTNPELDAIVQIRAAEILEKFAHTRPNGENCSTAYESEMYVYSGENILISMLGKNGANAATIIADMWLSSSGHRANIMNPDAVYVSVGAVRGPDNKVYCVQGFWK